MSMTTGFSNDPRQAGFGHIVTVAVIVLVFSTIGYIGFKLYAHPLTDSAGTGITTIQQAKADVPTAPNVNSAGDLDKAAAALDSVDPSSTSESDETSLDGQLSGLR